MTSLAVLSACGVHRAASVSVYAIIMAATALQYPCVRLLTGMVRFTAVGAMASLFDAKFYAGRSAKRCWLVSLRSARWAA